MEIATAALRVNGEGSLASGPAVRTEGSKGEIRVFGRIYRPTMYRVIRVGENRAEDEEVRRPIPKDPEGGESGSGC